MDNVKIKVTAVTLTIILIIILIVIALLSSGRNRTVDQFGNSVSTGNSIQDYSTGNFRESNGNSTGNKNSSNDPPAPSTAAALKNIPLLTAGQRLSVEKVMLNLPDTVDFKAAYSSVMDKFYIQKKSAQADEKIDEWLKTNNLGDIPRDFPGIIEYTETDPVIVKDAAETKYSEEREQTQKKEEEKAPVSSGTNNNSTSTAQQSSQSSSQSAPSSSGVNNLNLLVELLNILLVPSDYSDIPPENLGTDAQPSSASQTPSPDSSPVPITQPPISVSYPPSPLSLHALFQEAGEKVGVPPKILEGVMRIESPSTFNLRNEDIGKYSVPNSTMPNCGPNVCSATGPMQMTIGRDATGSTFCSRCGNIACPNAWSGFGRAVNTFGKYTHSPNPCNIRDNIYGAAAKLKNNSGAQSATEWTQNQVYLAGQRYYGSCAEKYRYPRLKYPGNPNPTYCEFLWWFYKNS